MEHAESHRSATSEGPYPFWLAAYAASKTKSLNASKRWMAEHNPAFDLVTIEPSLVIGPDETVTDGPQSLIKGSNAFILGPALGAPTMGVFPCVTVHVDDVAAMHVAALDTSRVKGNEDYLANAQSSMGDDGIEWSSAFDIIRNHFPSECASGTFKVDETERPATVRLLVDQSKAEMMFGIKFKNFEEQVLELAAQYIQLVRQQQVLGASTGDSEDVKDTVIVTEVDISPSLGGKLWSRLRRFLNVGLSF
jgi:nucleoside-diphosphate-sugar epimerase